MVVREFTDDIISVFKEGLQEGTKTKKVKILNKWFEEESGKTVLSRFERGLSELLKSFDGDFSLADFERALGLEGVE